MAGDVVKGPVGPLVGTQGQQIPQHCFDRLIWDNQLDLFTALRPEVLPGCRQAPVHVASQHSSIQTFPWTSAFGNIVLLTPHTLQFGEAGLQSMI